jgi:protein-S-isoprenylcysteine O-methyltransferase Ste14
MILLAALLGGGTLLAFLLFLLAGSLNLVNLPLDETQVLWLDAFLCPAFFVQHSVMIRRSFRERLASFVSPQYDAALFAIASGVVLGGVLVFWQASALTLAAPQGMARWGLRAVYFLSIAGFAWGIAALGSFDPFGITPILDHLRGREPRPAPLTVRGPYRWVRHPLYLFLVLMFWSCPDLTADRLLFNLLWTGWMIVGARFEERDLVAAYGEGYRDYQRRVPMLIPRGLRPAA